jgi:hypothetical protein
MAGVGFGLKAVSLFVMAAAITAAMAGGAQAEAGAKWLILSGGVAKTGEELPAEVVGSLENNDASLLSKIVGIKTKFLCTAATLVGVKLEGEGKLTNGSKLKYTGCKTYLNEELAPECETHSAGQPVGTLELNALKGELVLHEPSAGVKEGVTKAEPKEGETFISMELGAACPIGNKVPIIGKLFFKDCEGKLTTHLVTHLIEELKALTTLWTISKTAEHVSTVDGSVLVKLAGAHTGLSWGGMPG